MFETSLTVVGNVVNDPKRRRVGDQEVLKFRVASNSRRRSADGTWEPGNSLFVTVNCWGRLVSGVGASLGKGSPVIVSGHVYTSEYEDRDGIRRSTLEMPPPPSIRSVSLHRAGREDGFLRVCDRGDRCRGERNRTAAETAPDAEAPLPLSA